MTKLQRHQAIKTHITNFLEGETSYREYCESLTGFNIIEINRIYLKTAGI